MGGDVVQDVIEQRVTAWAGPKHTRKNLRAMLASFDTVSSQGHTPPSLHRPSLVSCLWFWQSRQIGVVNGVVGV